MSNGRDSVPPSSVLLVEDHASFREALAFVLSEEPDLIVTTQASSISEASGVLEKADIAVVDLGLPDGDGVDLVRKIRQNGRRCRSLVLTASLDPVEHARAVEAGAAGVIHKSSALEDIVDAVLALKRGEIPFSRETNDLLRLTNRTRSRDRAARQLAESFTSREREVLYGLAEGLDNAKIADRLGISIRTERTHMTHILTKLGANSRLHALILAVRCGAVDIR